jgi:hypothetical protein
MGPHERAAEHRHERRHEHGATGVATRCPCEGSAQQDDRHAGGERPRRKCPPEHLLTASGQARQGDNGCRQRRILEGDIPVRQAAVEDRVSEAPVDEQVVDALVGPRGDPERERPARGEQHQGRKRLAPHA